MDDEQYGEYDSEGPIYEWDDEDEAIAAENALYLGEDPFADTLWEARN